MEMHGNHFGWKMLLWRSYGTEISTTKDSALLSRCWPPELPPLVGDVIVNPAKVGSCNMPAKILPASSRTNVAPPPWRHSVAAVGGQPVVNPPSLPQYHPQSSPKFHIKMNESVTNLFGDRFLLRYLLLGYVGQDLRIHHVKYLAKPAAFVNAKLGAWKSMLLSSSLEPGNETIVAISEIRTLSSTEIKPGNVKMENSWKCRCPFKKGTLSRNTAGTVGCLMWNFGQTPVLTPNIFQRVWENQNMTVSTSRKHVHH